MRKNSAILLIVILLTTQLLGMANTPCVCDSTYKSTYRGKFLREIITIDGIDSLIDGKDFFVRYQDSHRALWTIVVRDSGGFNFIHPSLDRQSIIFAPSCSLDTIVTHTFSDIFNWILDSLSINGIVYERGPKEPFIDEHPGWRKVGFEVYQKDGSNIFAYDARDHSRIEAKNIDLEAFFHDFFFLEIWLIIPEERDRIVFDGGYRIEHKKRSIRSIWSKTLRKMKFRLRMLKTKIKARIE